MKLLQYPVYWIGLRSQRVRMLYYRLTDKRYLWGIAGLIVDRKWIAKDEFNGQHGSLQ